jgi:hypothetical protein
VQPKANIVAIIRITILASPLFGQALFEFARDETEREMGCALLGDNQNIQSGEQLLAAAPEKFPHEPFDPIPNHRVAYFATDGNA